MIKTLLDPFIVFWIGILLAVCFAVGKKKYTAKVLFILSLGCLFLVSVSLLPDCLVKSLESRYAVYHPEANDSTAYHILVLGSGHTEDQRLPPNAQLSESALARLAEGIRLYRLLPASKLVLSGYSSSGGTPQAKILKQTAVSLGVDEQRILLQEKPQNTYQEAQAYIGSYGDHPVIVVTSATHMPRAMKMFKILGREAIPAPTFYRVKTSKYDRRSWLPSVDNIENMHTAIIEYVGLWAADWRY